jgi:TPR repeat protein
MLTYQRLSELSCKAMPRILSQTQDLGHFRRFTSGMIARRTWFVEAVRPLRPLLATAALVAAFFTFSLSASAQTNGANAAQELLDKANAGDALAQLEMGRTYVEGKGVRKDTDEAIKWFYKAAGHFSSDSNHAVRVEPNSMLKGKLITVDGRTYSNPIVTRIKPDGIFITYKMGRTGFGMAELGFNELSVDVQKLFGYDPGAARAFAIQQEALREIGYAEAIKRVASMESNRSNVVNTLLDIVATYHKTHTYMTNDTGDNIYTCGDMACDVWNMVVSKHIPARIAAGDVHNDIASIAQANHAWVLAEISDGEWLALETTAGFAIRPDENKRYFFACRFEGAKEFRDFEALEQSYRDTVARGRAAATNFNDAVNTYNAADASSRSLLKAAVSQREAVLQDKMSELKNLKTQLDGYRLTEN